MADEQLKQQPLFNPATDLNAKNLYHVDKWVSGTEGASGVYDSKRIREGELPQAVNGYKRYIAELNQSGTANPTATVLVNELGATVVWTRDDVGVYTATLIGAFAGKTMILSPQNSYGFDGLSSGYNVYGAGKNGSDSVYLVSGLADPTTGIVTPSDALLFTDYSFIEIRVFN
jgi:hypothetical protein